MFNFFKKKPKKEDPHPEISISQEAPQIPEIDFDHLSKTCQNKNTRESMDALWGNVYKLKEWWFVARQNESNVTPFVGILENKPFIMAFTDAKRAEVFGRSNNLVDASGNVNVLSIPTGNPDYFMSMLQHGVFGILFNDGEAGFFAPLQNVKAMHDYFNTDKG